MTPATPASDAARGPAPLSPGPLANTDEATGGTGTRSMPRTPDTTLPALFGGVLSAKETEYALKSRAKNTLRGYTSDWADFAGWAIANGHSPFPADAETVNGHILALAAAGAAVPTIGRRLTSIRFAHEMAGYVSPTREPRVKRVWEGIRRVHRAEPDQAPALMPPVLWDILDALPATPAGHRDAAILLVGFVGALRRSELAAARVEHLAGHEWGRVLKIPQSKTDQYGAGQLVVLPRSNQPAHCPVVALDRWLKHTPGEGPLFRRVHRSGKVLDQGLSGKAINEIVRRACAAVLGDDHKYTAHSLRAGFVTYAAAPRGRDRGASDTSIMRQTRHGSVANVARYTRHESAWVDNAATDLGI